MHSVSSSTSSPPILVDLAIKGVPIFMELDTGVFVSIMPEAVWIKSWSNVSLTTSAVKLCTYSGTPLSVVGEGRVKASHNDQIVEVCIHIVKEGTAPLLGCNWLSSIQLNWPNICCITSKVSDQFQSSSVVHEFPTIFQEGIGHINGKEASIHLAAGTVPKCIPARPLLHALKSQVDIEIDRLVSEGIIEPVDFAEWTSPVVVVRKEDGSIRLCGDFKVTLNAHIELNLHPIPNPTDLLSSLSGATIFPN